MTGNGRVKLPRPPRALLLATGEDVPKANSIRARLLVIEVAPEEVDRSILSECQRAGDEPNATRNCRTGCAPALRKLERRGKGAPFTRVYPLHSRNYTVALNCGLSLR